VPTKGRYNKCSTFTFIFTFTVLYTPNGTNSLKFGSRLTDYVIYLKHLLTRVTYDPDCKAPNTNTNRCPFKKEKNGNNKS